MIKNRIDRPDFGVCISDNRSPNSLLVSVNGRAPTAIESITPSTIIVPVGAVQAPGDVKFKSSRFLGTSTQQIIQELQLHDKSPGEQIRVISGVIKAVATIIDALDRPDWIAVSTHFDRLEQAGVKRYADLNCPLIAQEPVPHRYIKTLDKIPDLPLYTFQADRHEQLESILNMPVPQGERIELELTAMHPNPEERWNWLVGLGVPFVTKIQPITYLEAGILSRLLGHRTTLTNNECRLFSQKGQSIQIQNVTIQKSLWAPKPIVRPTYSRLSYAWGLALEALTMMAISNTKPGSAGRWIGNMLLVKSLSAAMSMEDSGYRVLGAGYGKVHVQAAENNPAPKAVMVDGCVWRRVGAQHEDNLLQQKVTEGRLDVVKNADQMTISEL